ncbi:hypothetical protein NRB56_31170 [Nocardia sp. RB56]|uniref:PBP domain-containing protein n=1 Tax=Nocardia aurantia TaxID=2585199 RepID=A0A7K0DRT9_9NOCA|nr:hypothetical protein [Nocardia aurantia]
MDHLLTYVFAVVGVVVPVVAFSWEFILSGRKRLGYRVQVNDLVRASADSAEEAAQLGVLQQLLPKKGDDGAKPAKLGDMSIVLLKIENNGWTEIGHEDYRHSDGANSGITFRFPGRTVAGVALTAPSRSMKSVLRDHTSGVKTDLEGSDGLIVLPRFALGREDSYKIMAVLRRHPDVPKHGDELPLPEVDGGIRRGKAIRTESRTRMSTPYAALVTLLVAVVVVQFVTGLITPHTDPMDCEAGRLSLTGSTAIEKVMQDSAARYQQRCPGAHIDATGFKSSNDGLQRLDSGKPADPATQLAFTDGLNTDHPALVARPIAFVLFTPVINPEVTGVESLSRQQIADLYAGRYLNWRELGGPDLPVRLVGRHRSSGSRSAFEHEILEGDQPPDNSVDCHAGAAAPEPPRCEADTTADLLTLVARTPGAIGYSEVATAAADSRIRVIGVDGHRATRAEALAGAYHFGASEYAYSVGALPPDSLAAAFLRFLGFGEGKDILSKYGDAPCAELTDPVGCRPYR